MHLLYQCTGQNLISWKYLCYDRVIHWVFSNDNICVLFSDALVSTKYTAGNTLLNFSSWECHEVW